MKAGLPRNKRLLWCALLVLLVTSILVVRAFKASWGIASLRCADGSVLVISDVTFGTNHTWSKHGRLSSGTCQQWTSPRPVTAVWGVWKGRGTNSHTIRFVTMAYGGYVTSVLTNRSPLFGPGQFAGLLATTTNRPGMTVRLRMFEETNSYPPPSTGDFVVENKVLLAERSRNPKGWTVEFYFRHWNFGRQIFVANSDGPEGILSGKAYWFGPICFFQRF